MLKIKDDVKLEELEKFGFIKCPEYRWEDYILGDKETEFDIYDDCENFYIKDRVIVFEGELYGTILIDAIEILYNIIQAGLVEKVKE